jgi:Fur family ferric uptake transcriptional regulator
MSERTAAAAAIAGRPGVPGTRLHRRPAATGLVATLERAGVRITAPRRAVADVIAAHDGHFTAAELEAEARATHPGLGRATVFRTLDLFASLGLVERVDLPRGEHAYVVCEDAHHHHAICTACGRSIDVDDLGLGEVLATIAARSGFRVTDHRLEVFGRCADCDRQVGRA